MLSEVSSSSRATSNPVSVAKNVKCAGCNHLFERVQNCSRCLAVQYCGRACQTAHWTQHKRVCKPAVQPMLSGIAAGTNFLLRQVLQTRSGQNHITQTRALIELGCAKLNIPESTIVVCGAQYLEGKVQFVEPLEKFLNARKLILVDIDLNTLKELSKRIKALSPSCNVSVVQKDLSGIGKGVEDFFKTISSEVNLRMEQYCQKVMQLLSKLYADFETKPSSLDGILPKGESADVVISSMVASQLSFHTLDGVYQHKINGMTFHQWLADPSNCVKGNYNHDAYLKLSNRTFLEHIEDVFACAQGDSKGTVYFAESETIDGKAESPRELFDYAHTKWADEKAVIQKNWIWEDRNHTFNVCGMLIGSVEETNL